MSLMTEEISVNVIVARMRSVHRSVLHTILIPKKIGAVTVRDRDTMEQVRIPIAELDAYFADKFTF